MGKGVIRKEFKSVEVESLTGLLLIYENGDFLFPILLSDGLTLFIYCAMGDKFSFPTRLLPDIIFFYFFVVERRSLNWGTGGGCLWTGEMNLCRELLKQIDWFWEGLWGMGEIGGLDCLWNWGEMWMIFILWLKQ